MPRYETLIDSFERTLERLDLPDVELTEAEQEQLGRRAALTSAAEIAWEDHVGPLYDWKQVAEILTTVTTRQGVHDLGQRGRLLTVQTKHGVRYPAFQFKGGRALPGMREILKIFDEQHTNRWTVASWFCSEQDELGSETPQAWLLSGRPIVPVLTAARRLAAGLAR
jgi:hypothetical protein